MTNGVEREANSEIAPVNGRDFEVYLDVSRDTGTTDTGASDRSWVPSCVDVIWYMGPGTCGTLTGRSEDREKGTGTIERKVDRNGQQGWRRVWGGLYY